MELKIIRPICAVCSQCRIEFTINPVSNRPVCPKCNNDGDPESVEDVLCRQKMKLSKYREVDVSLLENYPGQNIDWKEFQYPFRSCLKSDGVWSNIPYNNTPKLTYDQLFDIEMLTKSTAYYHQYGINDEESWVFILKTPNNMYIYFTAGCDYTGFDCRGGGDIFYVVDNWHVFWRKCLDNRAREYIYTKNKI